MLIYWIAAVGLASAQVPSQLPITGRDPATYAYDSEMSADGWRIEDSQSQATAKAMNGPDIPIPDPDLPEYYLGFSHTTQDVVALIPTCETTAQMHRSVNGGAMSQLGTFNCSASQYLDYQVEPGVAYCYAIRPTSSDPLSNEICRQTPFEPFELTGLANSPAASRDLLERFDWTQTDAVYAGTSSMPTLWYMNILADDRSDLLGLRSMGIHTQTTPIFPAEQALWHADHEGVELDGKLQGQWIYALVPGPIYNDIRMQMLEQIDAGLEPGFRAVAFREIPVAAARAWAPSTQPSPITIEYVGQMGVEYNGYVLEVQPGCEVDGDLPVCSTQQPLIGFILRKAYDLVVDFIDNVIEGVQQAIGVVARLIKGEVTLTLDFRLFNTDSGFGLDQEVQSAWRGERLVLKDTRVHLSQGLALFKGKTDDQGIAEIEVAEGWSGKICLELENDNISFTSGWAETTACVGEFGPLTTDTARVVEVTHDRVNAFATMSDAADYVETVMGYDMPSIKVLVGWAAEHAGGEEGQSFAPCLGMHPVLVSSVLDLGLSFIPIANVAAALAEAFYSVDVILKDDDLGSRGVPVHEYGHTVMCSMMRSADRVGTDIALLDILQGIADGDQRDPAKEQTYFAEALADYLSLQVVGGTNYVNPTAEYFSSEEVKYCQAGSDCYEEDFMAADDNWEEKLRRVVSVLQDAFDNDDNLLSQANDGSHWDRDANNILVASVAPDSEAADESIELSSDLMLEVYRAWGDRGNTLGESTFFGGLAQVLLDRGYSKADVCGLFEAHDLNSECPDYVQALSSNLGLDVLNTYTFEQVSSGRFMDAHEHSGEDYRLVTRPAGNDDTQRWIVTPVGDGEYTIQQASNNRYVDAWETSGQDYRLVTRPAQANDSQRWTLTPLGNDLYTMQQVSNDRFVDAHEVSSQDYRMVTRTAQNNNSQVWRILPVDTFTIQQVSTNRYWDAHEIASYDYRMVTRTEQNNNSQRWRLTPSGFNTYTIQQVSSGRFADAHEYSSMDFHLVTRPSQGDDTQRWVFTPLGNDLFTIQQVSNDRHVDGHDSSSDDYGIVTRPDQNNSSQMWRLTPK